MSKPDKDYLEPVFLNALPGAYDMSGVLDGVLPKVIGGPSALAAMMYAVRVVLDNGIGEEKLIAQVRAIRAYCAAQKAAGTPPEHTAKLTLLDVARVPIEAPGSPTLSLECPCPDCVARRQAQVH